MFLKSVELFGFKSFADRSKLDFSSGITALLGPNGCGKSNIVDSIKWVLGEQSMKTLRAGKLEDVIFNGTESRSKLNVAEVNLIISNERGYLPLDVSEISIKRRVYRSGESEYYINNTLVRLKEIKELFYDTGIGKSAYSILEQGKIDQILSQKPEDRRYIFEEAAGITRFKQKSQEAERKLEKTEDNIRQVQSILKEVKGTYDTRKVQAERARRYKELQEKIFELEVDLQLSKVHELSQRKQQKITVLHDAVDEFSKLQESISRINTILEEIMDTVNEQSNKRIEIQNRLHRIDESRNSKKNQIDIYLDRIEDFTKSITDLSGRCELMNKRIERDTADIDERVAKRMSMQDELDKIEVDIETFIETIETAEDRIRHNTREIEGTEERVRELEKTQLYLRRDLQEITEHIVKEFDTKLSESGYSHHRRKELDEEIRQVISRLLITVQGRSDILEDAAKFGSVGKALVQKTSEELIGVTAQLERLQQLYSDYTDAIPSFIDEFLSPAGVLTKKRLIDEEIEQSYIEVEQKRELADTLSAENTSLLKKLQNYRETLEHLRLTEVDLKGSLKNIEELLTNLYRTMNEQKIARDEAMKDLSSAQERLDETKGKISELEQDSVEISQEVDELTETLQQLKVGIDDAQDEMKQERKHLAQQQEFLSNTAQRIERTKAEIDALETEVSFIYENFEENYSKSLTEFDERIYDIREGEQVYRSRLKQLRQEVISLGYINHMATEEFEEVRERYEFLRKQMNDLEQAKNDLLTITKEIKTRSEILFEESYHKIKKNFHLMFRRLFGGGRAELKLVDPDDLLGSGIDIFAQPPGKKLEKITLLSGGERSMTAVALLFATYLVKPSPFCILDEIDAALDDANIGYFLDVLLEFSESSQFIIITHNKKTVLGSSTLLGVTMQEPGVSKAIAYRIGDVAGEQTIF